MRFFNTEGPVIPADHFCIDPLDRVDIEGILTLIRQKKYFVMHAPRQTGKTSTLLALADRLNSSGEFRCLYTNVEAAQAVREDIGAAIRIVLSELVSRARSVLRDKSVHALRSEILESEPSGAALYEFLVRWSGASPKPLVLLIDEIDCLVGDALISVLRQIWSGYDQRPELFPQSVVLCGLRNVRDCRIVSSADNSYTAAGSGCNVKTKSLRLGDFTEIEVRALLAQHETETGQKFGDDALARIWELTRGQPWLVNALAAEACSSTETKGCVDAVAIDDAKEALVLARPTHLDQLADKLREDRVRRVVEPLLAGSGAPMDLSADDLDYVVDLGLVRINGSVEIANPIYREVVPRQLTYTTERFIPHRTAWYVDADGNLEIAKLLKAFQVYSQENGEHWADRFGYREAGPQLLLQAFLQRIVNAGGRLEREYGLGRGRTDLLIRWQGSGDPTQVRSHVIECKVVPQDKGAERTIRTGLAQTARYMDRCRAESGHLVIFDGRQGRTWQERLFRRSATEAGNAITVWGM